MRNPADREMAARTMKRSAPHSQSIVPGTRNSPSLLNSSQGQWHFTVQTTDECFRLASMVGD
jgi:hypothetical protein